ncbi:glutathione S-transferase family protein [Ensifer adhaerens]|uniref:glutathione S-transferase family protein n=1 Tax=Ensifer adhaerens TaxID=106592 RepID=UPI001CBAF81B|nr:glutathione S-transferase family protein [Ensifer adhaerens]MBZ7923675.1 glutathione S-transferase family protein [Ensifer adhaerens]UAX92227.1 glutathione S-transferase family protein [Ensifer adhaerens]UAX99859.1 glutathione S-transferase family protein [Ensifer adhaerens]UAY07243.1 glutathione S-transferase family protein [Ensifer adhaerens]
MTGLILYVGNKNYSSWSMRPWMAMSAAGIDFEDVVIPFDFAAGNPEIRAVSPTGRVPLLRHGELLVWESLAIIEYVAELFPNAGLWPADREARARARSYSIEMLSGFRALRGACPMNVRREKQALEVDADVRADVARIEQIWKQALARSGGPFLFGAFGAADAMYAPVVSRFDVYDLVADQESLGYMQRMKAHPAYRKWEEAARAEPWVVPEDEV